MEISNTKGCIFEVHPERVGCKPTLCLLVILLILAPGVEIVFEKEGVVKNGVIDVEIGE